MRIQPVVAVCLLVLLAAASASGDPAADRADEYPPWDAVASGQREGFLGRSREHLVLLADPGGLEAARIHVEAKRFDRALDVLESLVGSRPELLPAVLELLRYRDFRYEDRGARVTAIEAAAAKARAVVPVETAGRIDLALALLAPEGKERLARLTVLAARRGDDPIGLLARYELIHRGPAPLAKRVEEMDRFAKEHPGTEAARRALLEIAFQCGFNLHRGGEDPTPLFERLLETVARLEAQDPTPEELEKARGCRLAFFFTERDLHETAREAFLPVNRALFRRILAEGPPSTDVAWRVRHVFETIHRAAGVPGEELHARVLEELDALAADGGPERAVRTVRAVVLARAGDMDGAAKALEPLLEEGVPEPCRRRALAALAGIESFAGRHEAASKRYAEYAGRYPASACRWLAALRSAHALVRAGRLEDAVRSYREAAALLPEDRIVGVLAHAGAARQFERLGRTDEAVLEVRRALDRWTPDLGYHSLHTAAGGDGYPSPGKDDPEAPLAREHLVDALARLENRGPGSPVSDAFLAALDRSRSLLLEGSGDSEDSEARAAEVVEKATAALVAARTTRKPETTLERQVAAIRIAIIEHGLWKPEGAPPPFVVLDPEVEVVFPDAGRIAVTLRQEIPGRRVLWLTRSERARIEALLQRGEKEEQVRFRDLLARFFPVVHGHWGGWHLRTFPSYSEIRFTDVDRTRALVEVRVKYQGKRVALERKGDGFGVTSVRPAWIE